MESWGGRFDAVGYLTKYFLCHREKVAIFKNGLTRFEYEMDQLASCPFYLLLKSQTVSRQRINSSLVEETRRIAGFKLNWFLTGNNDSKLTEELSPRGKDWKPDAPIAKYEQPILAEMVQLARHLRMQNMTREQILDKVIGARWKISAF